MKRVIFVGGTAYSGSTFFHMVLANDPKGFATGEVQSLFNPHKPRHVNPECGCGDDTCNVWQRILERGEDKLYDSIFRFFPEVETIVTSSKDPFWIQRQNELVRAAGMEAKNVVIWKTPLEFAESAERRGKFDIWEQSWINYYRLYAAVIDEWRAVKYYELTHNQDETLANVCDYVGIPYFAGKEAFWQRTYHVLFGNYSAKMHLYEKDVAKEHVNHTFDKDRIQYHRKIYYRSGENQTVQEHVAQRVAESPHFPRILEMLKAYDVSRNAVDASLTADVRMALPLVKAREIKQQISARIGKMRYGAHLP